MVDKIFSVTVKGEFFTEPIEWSFESANSNDRLFLIYGNNGSGKTTFSKAIFEYKNSVNNTFENFEYVNFKDKSNNIVNLNKDSIWSFNDEFIQKNIRIKKSGISAIVMFGDAIDIDSQIESCKKQQELINEKRKLIDLDKYNNHNNPSCISDAYTLIVNELKSEWAINDRNIKGGQRNSAVNDSTIYNILHTTKSKANISELKKTFSEKLKLYNSISKKDVSIINSTLKFVDNNSNDIDILELLQGKIAEPINGDLEEKIMFELNRKNELVNLNNTKLVINNSNTCPTCFQPLSEKYKHSIIEAINNVYNEEAKNHIQKLQSLVLSEIQPFDFTPFVEVIDGITQTKINNLVNDINIVVKKYFDYIHTKEKNVFTPIKIDSLNLKDKIGELKKLIEVCNQKIFEYNKNIENIDSIKKELFELNNQMALVSIKPLNDKYEALCLSKKNDENKIEEYTQKIEELNTTIKILNAKKKNLSLGLNEINDDLLLIFHTRSKLQLILENGMYFVKSRGRRIEFNNLSVGEKNVIGLCYFFSLIRNGHSKANVFNDEMFIVLDDPISSFDFSNKYGIYSYLKKMFHEILEKNKKTKIIVLTHELEAMVNFDKIRGDLSFKRQIFKIKDKQLICYNVDSSNYINMLNEVIELVDTDLSISSENINTTRRILEAFCTFNYNMSLSDLLQKQDIFSTIENSKIRDYLSTSVYKIVLNNESHMKEVIKGIPENMGYDVFDESEKKQVIKDALILIYCLNKMHLKIILKDKFEVVNLWYKNLVSELSNEKVLN